MSRESTLVLALGVALLCLFGGCDVEFPEQELRFRHDAEADTLDVLFVYLGVTTPDDGRKALAKGRDVAERVLAGRREFMLLDWPFNVDLDEDFTAWEDPLDEDLLEVIEHVRLERAGAFLDDRGRLCGFQHFRLSNVGAALVAINRQLDELALRALDEGELTEQDLPWLDAAEQRCWREFVAGATPWFALEQGRLVVRLPVTESGAPQFLEQLLQAVREEGDHDPDFFAMLAAALSGLEVSDGVATLRFGHPEGADTVVHLGRAVEYSPALHALLVEGGLDLSDAPSLAAVRALLD